ncbi:transposase, partial [Rhodococcus sp. D-46]|nr:transposase [Rhodococcus sp. D-46]
MLVTTMRVSKRLACRAVGLARSTYARTPIAQTPADPDAVLRAILRDYARTHPLHGFRRAWAHLRHDQAMAVNKKKVHRLWKEEGLQVRIYHPRKVRNRQILWIKVCQATSDTGVSGDGSGVISTGRSRSLPLWNSAP